VRLNPGPISCVEVIVVEENYKKMALYLSSAYARTSTHATGSAVRTLRRMRAA